MTYFNTTKQTENQLQMFTEKAKNQEEEILELMKLYKKLSPSDVQKYFSNYPLTSVRLALTNLSNKGKLIKTDETKIGIYGRPEFIWKSI